MSTEHDDRPVSVRLGQVVPPEDPEDWSRPLTWVAALGMLAAPIVALTWFAITAPDDATRPHGGTWLLAAACVSGAIATGLTQRGAWRAGTATVGAALFAALASVAIGASVGSSAAAGTSPSLAHATVGAAAGTAGAFGAAPLMALFAGHHARHRLVIAPLALGIGASLLAVSLLFAA